MDPVDALVVSIIVLLCTCIPLHVLRVVRVRRAIREWVEELDAAGAYNPIRAAEVLEPWGDRYRSSALELLMRRGIVRRTASGRLYLEAGAGESRHTIACIRRVKPADECEYTFPAIEEF
jgi:hypothetical protein